MYIPTSTNRCRLQAPGFVRRDLATWQLQRRGFRLDAIHRGAVDDSRSRLKPEIPVVGAYGIPLRDEIELGNG